MITANELRIGNWVLSGGKPIQVTIKTFANEWGETLFQLLNPIPLTPEILEKCGFNGYQYNPAFLISKVDEIGWFKGELCIGGGHEQFSAPCQYVHQLQNLYFALTGEELNIEL